MVLATVQAEIYKLRRNPTSKVLLVLLIVFLALNYFAAYLLLAFPAEDVPEALEASLREAEAQAVLNLTLPTSLLFSLRVATDFGALLVVVLAAVAVGSEYSWGTLRTLLLNQPDRIRLLGAKVAAVSIVAALGLIAGLFAGTVMSAIITILMGRGPVIPLDHVMRVLASLPKAQLVLEAWLLLSLFLTVLTGHTVAGVVGGFVYYLAEGVVTGLPLLAERAAGLAPYLLGVNGNALLAPPELAVVPVWQAAILVGGYVILFLALSLLVFQRRQPAV